MVKRDLTPSVRGVLFHKRCVRDGGLLLRPRYWRRFLRDRAKRLRRGLRDEVHQRILWVLGQFERAELAPRHWRPVPELDDTSRAILETARAEGPSERLVALAEGFDTGLFDFLGDLLATTYSVHGRRAYHPVFMWKVLLAMMASGETEPATFLHRVNDSLQLRLFLEAMSAAEFPSARRIKGFLVERLAPVAEHVVLWFNVELVSKGRLEMGEEFGTDGIEMAAQARKKSDAVRVHLKPQLEWLLAELHAYLSEAGAGDLSAAEQEVLLDAFRELDWSKLGSATKRKTAILRAIRHTLRSDVVTPTGPDSSAESAARASPVSAAFATFAKRLAGEFYERMKAVPRNLDWDTYYDPECGSKTKYGKTIHGYGMQFVVDLAYGLVWAFAVFPANESFQPHIAGFLLTLQSRARLGSFKLTSDREFTIASTMHQWHEAHILHYGPRPSCRAQSMGIFTEADFEIHEHEHYAVCPHGKVLKRKPKMHIRGTHYAWHYQAKRTDCAECPLRKQCTTGKGARDLAVNVYREDLARQKARMEANPEVTRDLMGRHKALAEGTVNNLSTTRARSARYGRAWPWLGFSSRWPS